MRNVRWTPIGLIVGILVASPLWAGGILNPELTVSTGVASSPDITVGFGDSVILTFLDDEQVFVKFAPAFDGTLVPLTTTGPHASPRIYFSNAGVTSVVFEGPSPLPGAAGPDIFLASNQGGAFGTPTNLTGNTVNEFDPRITGGNTASARSIAWLAELGGADPTIVLSTNLASPTVVADGDEFDLAVIPADGTRHLVYQRDGVLYYRGDSGPGFATEITLVDEPTPVADPQIAIDPSGVVHVVYQQGADIFYMRKPVGMDFGAAQNVSDSASASTEPRIWANAAGLFIFFRQDDDLWRAISVGPFFLAPENLTGTPLEVEEQATYAIDLNNNLHLAYVRDGAVRYRNDAEVPEALFTATPLVGEVPVEVDFTDMSTGVIHNWFWDFGDGTTSTQPNPTHTYDTTGTYTVSLSVLGPGGDSTLVASDLIQVLDPSNYMIVGSLPVFQQQTGVYVPIYAINSDPIQGYQVALQWDCDAFDVSEITVIATEANHLAPEFVAPDVDSVECEATLGVLFDILAPFDGRTLPPGTNQRIANLVVDVPGSAPVGPASIELMNGLGDSELFNIFTVEGLSVLPVLVPGEIDIQPFVFPLPALFVRGDVDFNSQLQITDAIALLDHLFSGAPPPICPDAADANDSGAIDVSDVIFLLDFLFQSGHIPLPPYPNPGLDPTPDPLGDC